MEVEVVQTPSNKLPETGFLEGSELELQCSVLAGPGDRLYWTLNDVGITYISATEVSDNCLFVSLFVAVVLFYWSALTFSNIVITKGCITCSLKCIRSRLQIVSTSKT